MEAELAAGGRLSLSNLASNLEGLLNLMLNLGFIYFIKLVPKI